MPRVAIAGCGYVGNALARLLLEEGHEVFGIRRHKDQLADGIQPVTGDLTRPQTLPDPPPDLDLAVCAVAADEASDAAYRRAYLDAQAGFLHWLGQSGQTPRRYVMLSSTGVYGQHSGELVDENSPTEPASFRGEVMLAAEELAAASSMTTIAVRLGGIYGPGRQRLIDRARTGRLQKRGYPHYTNRIHRDDAAGLVRHLLFTAAPQPLYLGVDNEPAEEGELFDWLATRLSCPIADPDQGATSSAQMSGRGVGSKRCSNQRLRDSGYSMRYPSYREGLSALLEGVG